MPKKIRKADFITIAKLLAYTLRENEGVQFWIAQCKSEGIDVTIDDLRDCFDKIQSLIPGVCWPKCGHMQSWKEHRKVFPETYTVPVV